MDRRTLADATKDNVCFAGVAYIHVRIQILNDIMCKYPTDIAMCY